MKKPSVDTAVVDIFHREVGHLSTRKFTYRLAASEDLVMRLDLVRKLQKHMGCVNTVSFNADGDILISGSDDRQVILWDWETGSVKLAFDSGHNSNVFQAKIMPETDERSIVTCAADGQYWPDGIDLKMLLMEVRHATILECGNVDTKLLSKHDGRAHKLANEPNSPHILYSCGEDGLVQHFDLRTGEPTQLFTCQPVHAFSYMSVVHLNDIAIDPRNPNLFVVGGSDEFTRLYDIRKYKCNTSADFGEPADYFCPKHLLGDENVGITGLAFSEHSELLVSYAEEFIYCFSKDMGWGSDVSTILADHLADDSDVEMETDSKPGPQLFKGHRNCATVKGVSFFGPKCEYVSSGSDCGRMFIWRKKDAKLVRLIEADTQVVNCIEAHPDIPMLASSGMDKDIKIWTPTALEKASYPTNIEKMRPKTGIWMHRMVSPRDMALQLLARQNQQTSSERVVSNGLEFIITFDANSSDEDDSEE
ncbi:WD40 repeat-containing protein [Artemisia annua]|uniref:WD40 repeat-containing protein n=1 Tax=Artemisia annua TaxID=35608 RepID=A0A2U1Q491_ARTAN|nr:WD40 repeat-containing protein [Artemisia annua]